MNLLLREYVTTNLPQGWLPYFVYDIELDNTIVGTIVLRTGTWKERYYDGHIGYTIEERYRGHHYALIASWLVMIEAAKLGFRRLIITCSPDNLASKNTIKYLPAKYLETTIVPKAIRKHFNKGEIIKEIYRIDLEER